MNLHGIFFILLLLTMQVAGAVDIQEEIEIAIYIKELLSQKCFDGDWSVVDKHGSSKSKTQSMDHIRAYIDIVGFKNECIINNTNYVNGDAKDFAIVKRRAWYTPVNGQKVSLETSYTITDIGNKTIATQTTRFTWKYYKNTLLGGKWVYVDEGPLTVKSSVESPENFSSIPEIPVHIAVHNRTVNPIAIISIPSEANPIMKNVVATRVSYNGSETTRYDKIGWIVKNWWGTELVEFVDKEQPLWEQKGEEISHQFHRFVIFCDREKFNKSCVNISFISPYEVQQVKNYTIDEISHHAKIPTCVIKLILTIIGSVMFIKILIGVVRRVYL